MYLSYLSQGTEESSVLCTLDFVHYELYLLSENISVSQKKNFGC